MKITDDIREKFINYIVCNPKRTLGIFVLINAFVLPGLAMMKTDFTYKAWYNDSDPQVKEFQQFERTFGNDDSLIIIVKDKKGVLNKRSLTAIGELTETMWKTSEIVRVDSLNNFQYTDTIEDELVIEDLVYSDEIGSYSDNSLTILKNKIDNEPVLKGYLISNDYKSSIVQAFVRPAIKSIPDHSAITKDVRSKLDAFKLKYPHLEVHLSGPVTIVDDFKTATMDDMMILIPLLYLMFIGLLYWEYKSVASIVLIFSAISSSTVLMLGAAGYADQHLNTLTSACPTILMTVALSDAVHIFSSFFFGLSNKFSIESSLFYSLKKNFFPTLLTSLTTGVGFLSFYDAKVEPVAELGIIVFFGVIFAWLVTYLGLAPVVLLLKRFYKKFEIGREESREIENNIVPTQRAVMVTNFLQNKKYPILLVTIVLCFFSFHYIQKLNVNMDPMEQFSSEHHSVKANNFLNDNFGYNSIIEMVVDSGLKEGAKDPVFLNKVKELIKWLDDDENIVKTISLNSILKSLNKSLHQGNQEFYSIPKSNREVAEYLLLYSMGLPQGKDVSNLISLDNQKLHLSSQWNLKDSQASLDKIEEIEAKAKMLELDMSLTGKTPLFHELTPYIVKTFFESFLMAFIGITIILILSLKSFTLGLLALIPNIFPLLLGGGLFYFTGYDIDMGTVIVASVCLGIAVDDSIHFLFEYAKYKKQGHSAHVAIEKLLTSTYPALLMTTLLISLGFSSFIFGSYVPNIKFGLCVSGVLIIALVADFVILPAVVLALDRKVQKNVS